MEQTYQLDALNKVRIGQVSPYLSCSDICQIWSDVMQVTSGFSNSKNENIAELRKLRK